MLLVAIYGVYRILTVSRVLTVTKEGIIPHFALSRDVSYVIPWDNIKSIYVAQQRTRRHSRKFLAVQVFDTEMLDQNQTSVQNFLDTLNTAAAPSDNGRAAIYISALMFNKSAEAVVEEISLFRARCGV